VIPRLNLETARRLNLLAEPAFRAQPERVLQIGSGNFLRAFCGWMIDRANRQGLFGGCVVVSQATATSRTAGILNEQDGLYTVLSRGLVDERAGRQVELIQSVSRGLNPYTQWNTLLELASNPAMRFVVSNTTEAGIVYKPCPPPADTCPSTFPAQLTALLFGRFRQFKNDANRGLVILPCELIDHNGRTLAEIVQRHANDWQLPAAFHDWLRRHCVFAETLVDRIVPGFPVDEIDTLQKELGYDDRLLVAAETYHSWIIQADWKLAAEWPLAEAGLNVTWTEDLTAYRTRKVRILNGTHTVMVGPALLAGHDTVLDALENPRMAEFVRAALYDEIIPSLELPVDFTRPFADEALRRFRNPYIRHRLTDIALNAFSKWKVRVLPSVRAYLKRRHRLPPALTLSLAALTALYRGRVTGNHLVGKLDGRTYQIADEPETLAFLAELWDDYEKDHNAAALCRRMLGCRRIWGEDLNEIPGLQAQVARQLETTLREGILSAVRQVG